MSTRKERLATTSEAFGRLPSRRLDFLRDPVAAPPTARTAATVAAPASAPPATARAAVVTSAFNGADATALEGTAPGRALT